VDSNRLKAAAWEPLTRCRSLGQAHAKPYEDWDAWHGSRKMHDGSKKRDADNVDCPRTGLSDWVRVGAMGHASLVTTRDANPRWLARFRQSARSGYCLDVG
jgi:hypothetical protein